MTSNSINISIVHTGCCKAEFDSTYPVHLTGIISQIEYQESIARINRRALSNKLCIINIISIILVVMTMCSIIIFVIELRKTLDVHNKSDLSIASAVRLILILLGTGLFLIGIAVIQRRCAAQLLKAVADESMRYSTRSPIPCSWRLETTTSSGDRSGRHIQAITQVVIDIGRPIVSENAMNYTSQDVNESQMLYSPQDPSAPPPYSSQFAVFCTHCGMVPLDLTANFCSSCGHAFNK